MLATLLKIMCCPFFEDARASVKFDSKFILNQIKQTLHPQ